MSVVIREGKFVEDAGLEAGGAFIELDQYTLRPHDFDAAKTGIDIPNDIAVENLQGVIGEVEAIRIPFPSFTDGRGFSLARKLRRAGFSGLLRARGHVLADQYPLALRCGFDDVEIPAEQAGRQPQKQWLDAFARVAMNYQDRLRTAPPEAA